MNSTRPSLTCVASNDRLPSSTNTDEFFLKSRYEFGDGYSPLSMTEDEEVLLRIALNIRIQYYVSHTPKELLTAWAGACWCSDAPIGDFEYGPAPGDPSMSANIIKRFFALHEQYVDYLNPAGRRLEAMDEETLNRQCLVLALFEQVVNRGLDECADSPLFDGSVDSTQRLINLPPQHLVHELTRRSYAWHDGERWRDIEGRYSDESLRTLRAALRPSLHHVASRLRVMNFAERCA